MFAGIDDHEIFDAPHGQDNDLTEEEEEGLVTEVITDVELSHLDSHQRSIMISEIMERTFEIIRKSNEESRDEMADLKSLENQMNREEITKMIKKQERRAKEIAKLHKEARVGDFETRHNDWNEEEAHILDEQKLMSVEIDNSQRQVDGLLHLCDASRSGAVENLSGILMQLEEVVESLRQKAEEDLENVELRMAGGKSVIQEKISHMTDLLEKMDEEKTDIQYNLEKTEMQLGKLSLLLSGLREQLAEKDKLNVKARKRIKIEKEKNIDLEMKFKILSEHDAAQKMELAGMEALKNESLRAADLHAQLTVQEKRAKGAIEKAKEYEAQMKEANEAANKLQKTVSALETRLDEEKGKTSSLTQKNQAAAKGVANMGSSQAIAVAEAENMLKASFTAQINALKEAHNNVQVQQNIEMDEYKRQCSGYKSTDIELKKQMAVLRRQLESGGSQGRSTNDHDLIASLKDQRDRAQQQVESLRDQRQKMLLDNHSNPILNVERNEIDRLQIALKESQSKCSQLHKQKLELLRSHERSSGNPTQEQNRRNVTNQLEEQVLLMEESNMKLVNDLKKFKVDVRHYQGLLAKMGIADIDPPPPPPIVTNSSSQTLPRRRMAVLTARPTFKEEIHGDDSNNDQDLLSNRLDNDSIIERDGKFLVDRGESPFFNDDNSAYLIDEEYMPYDVYDEEESEVGKDGKRDNVDEEEEGAGGGGKSKSNSRRGGSLGGKGKRSSTSMSDGRNSSRGGPRTWSRGSIKRNSNAHRRGGYDVVTLSEQSVHDVGGEGISTTESSRKESDKQRGSAISSRAGSSHNGASSRNGALSRNSVRSVRSRRSGRSTRRGEEGEEIDKNKNMPEVGWEDSHSRPSSYLGTCFTDEEKLARLKKVRQTGVGRIVVDVDDKFLKCSQLYISRPKIVILGESHFSEFNKKRKSELGGEEENENEGGPWGDVSDENKFDWEARQTVAVQTEGNEYFINDGEEIEISFSSYLAQKKKVKEWQDRVWELQQITYLMDTLVPAREFYRTRAGIGSTSEASVRYYEKPNTTPPPLQACKDLLWLLQREIVSSRSLQASDNWQYLCSRLKLKFSQAALKKDANESMLQARQFQTEEDEEDWRRLQEEDEEKDNQDEQQNGDSDGEKTEKTKKKKKEKETAKKEKQKKKEKAKVAAYGLIAASEKWGKASDSVSRVWEQRRVMFQTQRQRRWEQCLDCMVTLSNYSNQTSSTSSKNNNLLLPMSETSTSLIDSFDSNTSTSRKKVLEMLKSMVPFLPPNLHTFGTDKAARLLLEVTERVQEMDVSSSRQMSKSPRAVVMASSMPHMMVPQTDMLKSSSLVQQQYATAAGLRLQSTPFLMRKETEWWNSKQRTSPRSPRAVGRSVPRLPHAPYHSSMQSPQQSPRMNNRRTAAYKRPLEIASSLPAPSKYKSIISLGSDLPVLGGGGK